MNISQSTNWLSPNTDHTRVFQSPLDFGKLMGEILREKLRRSQPQNKQIHQIIHRAKKVQQYIKPKPSSLGCIVERIFHTTFYWDFLRTTKYDWSGWLDLVQNGFLSLQ
eukprot:TRINITY_DN8305_c1_g1_i1.p2 TRINITY_DN8305_c1_g1~~TRINITY_DN8305_c1_g1_i1.p2  ORF type:complete len:109 (+),score=5.87 TRINITY_DN8305_c1_g1_i1:172-498(+)